jgi:ornithine cyclodeaminase/alanine dehydrogenase-like protein (mu-crystallin family)
VRGNFGLATLESAVVLMLSNADVDSLLPPADVITAVEDAMRAHEDGTALTPARQHLEWAQNTLLTMPASAADCVGVKLVSVVPGNSGRGLPVTNGVMVLIDSATGIPTALISAASLTAQRTGAVGAVGLKHIARRELTSVGIIGTGVQGAWQAIFASAVRPIRTIFFVARSDLAASSFRARVLAHAPGVSFERCRDARELLERTDVIIAATTSALPVLPDEPALLMNKHFISIGSFKPTMQELPDAVYRLAGMLVIDSEQARTEVGDVVNPVARGILSDENIFHIGELVVRRREMALERTTVFKSVGMALYDLFVARAFLAAARRKGIGVAVRL